MIDVSTLPDLPIGYRWRFTTYGGGVNLLLEKKVCLFFWTWVGRAHVSEYGSLQANVQKAAEFALDRRDWVSEIRLTSREKREAQHRAQFPMGPVKK